MFLGVRSVVYHVEDLQKAKEWYTKVLGIEPHVDKPFYVGFNVGGFELVLDPDMDGFPKGRNIIAYWGVEDVKAEHRRLLELGATTLTEPQDVAVNTGRAPGIIAVTLLDPFGNMFGIIEHPRFRIKG
jgi:catechol 2,3-dioxygenase-like lactoylglutathione lyase family enzyme